MKIKIVRLRPKRLEIAEFVVAWISCIIAVTVLWMTFPMSTALFATLLAILSIAIPCGFFIQLKILRLGVDIPVTRNSDEQAFRFELLKNRVDDYCAQTEARRRQFPWLLSSLLNYCVGFACVAYGFANAIPIWPGVALTITLAFAAMVLAGIRAEDDPPKHGDHVIMRHLAEHAPLSKEAHEALCARLFSGAWRIEDLVGFVAKERSELELMRRRFAVSTPPRELY